MKKLAFLLMILLAASFAVAVSSVEIGDVEVRVSGPDGELTYLNTDGDEVDVPFTLFEDTIDSKFYVALGEGSYLFDRDDSNGEGYHGALHVGAATRNGDKCVSTTDVADDCDDFPFIFSDNAGETGYCEIFDIEIPSSTVGIYCVHSNTGYDDRPCNTTINLAEGEIMVHCSMDEIVLTNLGRTGSSEPVLHTQDGEVIRITQGIGPFEGAEESICFVITVPDKPVDQLVCVAVDVGDLDLVYLPDLVITDIAFDPENPVFGIDVFEDGEDIEFTPVIENWGAELEVGTPFITDITIRDGDGNTVDGCGSSSSYSGGGVYFNIDCGADDFPGPGTYYVTATVDDGTDVEETVETNNNYTKELVILGNFGVHDCGDSECSLLERFTTDLFAGLDFCPDGIIGCCKFDCLPCDPMPDCGEADPMVVSFDMEGRDGGCPVYECCGDGECSAPEEASGGCPEDCDRGVPEFNGLAVVAVLVVVAMVMFMVMRRKQ